MRYLGLLFAITLLVACNNGKQGTKFAPKEREQVFAYERRFSAGNADAGETFGGALQNA